MRPTDPSPEGGRRPVSGAGEDRVAHYRRVGKGGTARRPIGKAAGGQRGLSSGGAGGRVAWLARRRIKGKVARLAGPSAEQGDAGEARHRRVEENGAARKTLAGGGGGRGMALVVPSVEQGRAGRRSRGGQGNSLGASVTLEEQGRSSILKEGEASVVNAPSILRMISKPPKQ